MDIVVFIILAVIAQSLNVKSTPETGNSTPDTWRRAKRQAASASNSSMPALTQPANQNGPSFTVNGSTGLQATTGILSSTGYGSGVIQIHAVDVDSTPSIVIYSIISTVFFAPDGSYQKADGSFTVDNSSGRIYTALPDYSFYASGHFEITVSARDDIHAAATAIVNVFIAIQLQRIRYVIDKVPKDAQSALPSLIREHNLLFPNIGTQFDSSVRYHVIDKNNVDKFRSDLCFIMFKNNQVLDYDTAISLIKSVMQNNQNTFRQFENQYTIETFNQCVVQDVIATALVDWDSYWYLWWILIAQALFIFLVTLILIVIVCCCCLFCAKKKPDKPYIILDPMVPVSEYEWHNESAHM